MMEKGIGAVAGSLAVASVRRLNRPGIVQLVLGVLLGLSLAIFAFCYNYRLGLVMMVIVGIVSSSYLSLNATLIMDVSDRRYHGRVMSVYLFTFSALPLGNMILSLFADIFSVSLTVGVSGLVLAGIVLLFGLLSPAYRSLRFNYTSQVSLNGKTPAHQKEQPDELTGKNIP